jgi:4-hydroxybenzoate polyprenyltransferase
MLKLAKKIILEIENVQLKTTDIFVFFFFLIVLRIFTEAFLSKFYNTSATFLFFEFTHTFLFFLISFLLFIWIIKISLAIELKKIFNVLSWGFLIILLPPIIDFFISKGEGFWSFYAFDGIFGLVKRFFTFFGDNPQMGITYGVRFEVAISLLLIMIYAYIKTEKLLRSLFLTISTYVVFFILGTFPSWIAIAMRGWEKGFLNVSKMDVAQIFLTPVHIFSQENNEIISALNIKMSIIYSLLLIVISSAFLFYLNKKKFVKFMRNVRPPQIGYHCGLLLVGIGLGMFLTKQIVPFSFFNILSLLLILSSVSLSWIASVVFNDIFDRKIDLLTNKNRPLIENIFMPDEYARIGWIMLIASIFFSAIVSFKISLLLLAYQALAWMYSAYPLRLKRFAFISTAVSALASLIVLFSGFILISPAQNIVNLPSKIIWLFFISLVFSLPLKDFKDIQGDQQDGVFTIPVIFGEYWGKIIVGGGILISYILSVFFLNESRLLWWAILFGGISFWLVNYSSSNQAKKINHRNLPWWIMFPIIFYALILIKIIFT